MEPLLATSNEWYDLSPFLWDRIMDPDGWDRGDWDFSWYEELITQSEFKDRIFKSTCTWGKEMKNYVYSKP